MQSKLFCVERLDKSFEKEGYKTSDASLNKLEYFHQKVLGPGQQPEIDATKLIAAYFPFLLKYKREYDNSEATDVIRL
jgi:hypothetical protein